MKLGWLWILLLVGGCATPSNWQYLWLDDTQEHEQIQANFRGGCHVTPPEWDPKWFSMKCPCCQGVYYGRVIETMPQCGVKCP